MPPLPVPTLPARARLAIAAVTAGVALVIAAPGHDIERAQAGPDPQSIQPYAATPTVEEGPVGRIALNGPWTLRGDHSDHGLAKGWQTGGFVGSLITVPNSPNAKRVTGPKGVQSYRGSIAWYRTTFSVPDTGDYSLHFDSVNHKAMVWVDGRLVARHTGTYLPFDTDVTLDAGREHTLVVRADYRDPYAMKRAAWHRTWFNFGGINREVTIRPIGASDLTAPTVRTRIDPGTGDALVDVTVHVRNRRPDGRSITVDGSLEHDGSKTDLDFPPIDVPGGQTKVVAATARVSDPALWSPDDPNLYDLKLNVPQEAGYELKTGLRTIERRGTQILLNGKPFRMKGASLQEDVDHKGDALTGADMDRIIDELKAIGANATRAQHPISPALLERLDKAGIMIWQGIGPVDAPGNWTSKTPALRAQSSERVRETFFQCQTHPSILAWNLANEVAGNGHPGGQAEWIDETARDMHRRDPGRLVALDVWGAHPPKVAGPMYSHIDAIGDTNYIGWYEHTHATRPQLREIIRAHLAGLRRVFPDKILAVTEFGAEANSENPTDVPGGFRYQSDLLALHIGIYKSTPGLAGMLVWNLRDFAVSPDFAGGSIKKMVPGIHVVRGLNQKGVFTYDGRPKPSVQVVRDALSSFR